MKKNLLMQDIKKSYNFFKSSREIRNSNNINNLGVGVKVPLYEAGVCFLDTVEGCTIANCGSEIYNIASNVFRGFSDEEKRRLSFSPIQGEFVERLILFKERLRPVLTKKQYYLVMSRINRWYRHIKTM